MRVIREWRVLEGVETLSDHAYIVFEGGTGQREDPEAEEPGHRVFREWNLRICLRLDLDRDMLRAALLAATWAKRRNIGTAEEETEYLVRVLRIGCEVSMRRAGGAAVSRGLPY